MKSSPSTQHLLKPNYRYIEGIFFALNFLPWEFLLVKNLEIEKPKTIEYITFKIDIIKVVLVFFDFQLFY